MKLPLSLVLLLALVPSLLRAQIVRDPKREANASFPTEPSQRRYQDGEQLSYHMQGIHQGKAGTETYEADAVGVVKKDSDNRFFEEYQWTNLTVNKKKIDLPPESVNYRQVLSLDAHYQSPFPKLAPMLVGPILDLFTFYVDIGLATRTGSLTHPGDHVYVPYGKPSSWANGSVILGEDSIDFDITVKSVDSVRQIATVVVRHVPPPKPEITIPAEWMRQPVADTPNNWVEVRKEGDRYIAAVGKETFDCEIEISLTNGKMVSATMDNPVDVLERECQDKALTKVGPPIHYQIRRQIKIQQR